MNSVLYSPYTRKPIDSVDSGHQAELQRYNQQLWLPQVMRWDLDITADGYYPPARIPCRRCQIVLVRLYNWTAADCDFKVRVYWEDQLGPGVNREVFASSADYPAAIPNTRYLVEKVPTSNTLLLDPPVNIGRLYVQIVNFARGPQNDVTIEVVLDPVTN